MKMSLAWVDSLAAHIYLTDRQVEKLDAIRLRLSYPDDLFRIVVEKHPVLRSEYFRQLFETVVAMTPILDDEFYATRMAWEYYKMHRTISKYVAEIEAGATPARLPRFDAPIAPEMPDNRELGATLQSLRMHRINSVKAFTEATLAAEMTSVKSIADLTVKSQIVQAYQIISRPDR
jgi:hypothetical protein